MNKKQRLKLKHRKDTVLITLEPDYNHEAWGSDTPPTPHTVPDAFYQRSEPAHPQETAPETRRKPHRALSTSMLRQRLYRAGIKGVEAKRMLAEIIAGEQKDEGIAIPMSWSVSGFRERFGRRVARVVLRFVHVAFIVMDEAWMLLQPTTAQFVDKGLRAMRKFTSAIQFVEQTLPPMPKTVARRVSFHL